MKASSRFTFVVSLIFFFTVSVFSQAVIDSHLSNALVSATGPVEVVVTFNGEGAPNLADVTLLRSVGILNGVTFSALPIAGVFATASQVNKLANSSLVKSLYLNRKLTYFNNDSRAITGVDRLRNDQEITSTNGGMPVSGKGIGVLINDSGVDGTHNDLKYGTHLVQNVLGTVNLNAYSSLLPVSYIENVPNTDEIGGHGTHVAGTVGGTGQMSNGKYAGVAPGADLLGYGSGAELFILDAIGGFNYALTNQFQYGIRIITNSWGTSGNFDVNDPVNVASYAAYRHGITVTFAAGNDGPGENTLNPYAVAPWVISVAAGDRYGSLADFSSRGVKDQTGTVTVDGIQYTYKLAPTITAPGVLVISTRALVSNAVANGLTDDTEIETAYLPYYTRISGTSMATPHVAGIVALILQANPRLSPDEVKEILQETATNIPNRQEWEVGAGYVNAYEAVKKAFNSALGYGSTVNAFSSFNSNINYETIINNFVVDYDPVLTDNNQYKFNVASGITVLAARIDTWGLLGQTGNSVNLILIAPDKTEYSSGITLLFAIDGTRTVNVVSPIQGEWTVELRGLRGDASNPTMGAAFPETIPGYVKQFKILGATGLNDIAGSPAEVAIKLAVSERLVDGLSDGTYRPNDNLSRYDLARYMVMGSGVRQYLPFNGVNTFTDISSDQIPVVLSVTDRGAAIRDRFQVFNGVMIPTSPNTFDPSGTVNRTDLAYSMVQSLGLQSNALALNGTQLTVNYKGEDIAVDDASSIPAGMEGYVQLAIDLNLINVYFSLEQGPYDLEPTLHANFKPLDNVTRGDFAVIVTRTFTQWQTPDPSLGKSNGEQDVSISQPLTYGLQQNYPNPFNPSTVINYSIPSAGLVTLDVFNVLGQKVATLVNDVKPAGIYSVIFDASKLSSGIYIYRISANNYIKTMKMALMK